MHEYVMFFRQTFRVGDRSKLTTVHELWREISPVFVRLNIEDATSSCGLRFELYGCKSKSN